MEKIMFRSLVKRVGLLALVGLVWWWLSRNRMEESKRQPQPEITVPTFDEEEPGEDYISPTEPNESNQEPSTEFENADTSEADDLKVIDGIGPKISSVLQSAGITSYRQLATMNYDQIQKILDNAEIRLARFETWPEQAKFASAGDWKGLKKFVEDYKAQEA
jgi:predicted flap endonuclease-1-like 5' DNA nuclease